MTHSGWTQTTIGELIDSDRPITYGVVQPGEHDPEGIPLVRGGDFAFGWRPIEQYRRVSPEVERSFSRARLKAGDLVITIKGDVGTVAIVPDFLEGANISQTNARVAIDPSKAETEIIVAFLQSYEGRRQISAVTQVGAQPGLIFRDILSLRLQLPPLSEQRRIAEILRSWDLAIEKLEALRAAKERRFSGAMHRLFGPTRAVGGGKRPKGWTASNFGEIFIERKDKNVCLTDADVVTVGKYRIGKQSDHFTRSVASNDLSPYWMISPRDFVYDPMSAYYGALGRYDAESDGLVSPAYRVIQLRDDLADSDFIVQLLRTGHIRFLLETRSSQGNKEGKRRSLQRSAFDSIEFFLPPLHEQKRLASMAAEFEADIAATAREITALQRQKRGLMQKLLTGDWRVKPNPSQSHKDKKEAAHG